MRLVWSKEQPKEKGDELESYSVLQASSVTLLTKNLSHYAIRILALAKYIIQYIIIYICTINLKISVKDFTLTYKNLFVSFFSWFFEE